MSDIEQPASIQSQVLDYVVALLGGAAANVERCRMDSYSVKQLPADNVLPMSEDAENVDNTSTDVKHRFVVRHAAASVNAADRAVDARYVRAAKLILDEQTLGGLVRFTRYTGRKWEFENGEVDTVALAVMYEVEFSTNRADPSLPGL